MTIPAKPPKARTLKMEIGDETPTVLYRLYDARRRLLYVGITGNIKGRLAQHAANKDWWPDVARKMLEWHATRQDAAEAETEAIRDERPVYNIQGAQRLTGTVTVDAEDIMALVEARMPPTSLRLALLELAGMTTPEALDALGVRREHRSRVITGRASAALTKAS